MMSVGVFFLEIIHENVIWGQEGVGMMVVVQCWRWMMSVGVRFLDLIYENVMWVHEGGGVMVVVLVLTLDDECGGAMVIFDL